MSWGVLTRSALLTVSFLTGALAGRGVPGPADAGHHGTDDRGDLKSYLRSLRPEMEVSFDFHPHPMSSVSFPLEPSPEDTESLNSCTVLAAGLVLGPL